MTVFSNKDFHDHDFKNVIEVETIHIWTRKSYQVMLYFSQLKKEIGLPCCCNQVTLIKNVVEVQNRFKGCI